MKSISVTLFLVVLLAAPSFALSQSGIPPELTSEFNLNTFAPPSTPDDGIEIDYAQVLESGQFGFNILAQVDDDPLTWQNTTEDGGYEQTGVARERLILMHLGGAVGLFDYGQVAVQLPFYADDGRVPSKPGLGDLRLVPKGAYRFSGGLTNFGIGLLVPVSFPTGEEERLLGEGTVSIAPTLALDGIFGKLRVALNAGYYYRSEQDRDLLRGSEIRSGLGFSFDILKSETTLRAVAEVDAATQVGDAMGRQSTPVVVMGGAKQRFSKGFGWVATAGAGVTPGVGAPDFRMILGLDYVYQPSEKPKIVEGPRRDSDGDGILDSQDNCPEEPEDFDGFEDEDGCPEDDNDGDGILDKKDDCPNEPENQNGITDEDGCPEFDSDGDGITDGLDNCPDEAEDLDGLADGDGCPEDDADFDNITDTVDSCPDLPESVNRYKDADGCPDYMHMEKGEIVLDRALRFKRNGTDLKKISLPVVDELAEIIIARPEWTEIEFIVHTSGKGDDASQQELSEGRALALMRLLVHSGVVPERLIATGKGNSEPVASPATLEGQMNNERVQIFVRKGASK